MLRYWELAQARDAFVGTGLRDETGASEPAEECPVRLIGQGGLPIGDAAVVISQAVTGGPWPK